MKTPYRLLLSAALLSTTATVNAQSLIAHWDFNDGATSSSSLIPEANSHPCVTVNNVSPVGVGYSWSTRDSEDNSNFGANCFNGWNDAGPNYVSFKVTADANAVGSLSNFNFDIANYGGASDPTQFQLSVLKNGLLVTQSAWLNITGLAVQSNGGNWSGTPDQNFALTGLSTAQGSSDMIEFRIAANQAGGLIALDNARLSGSITCIPEPTSSALLPRLA